MVAGTTSTLTLNLQFTPTTNQQLTSLPRRSLNLRKNLSCAPPLIHPSRFSGGRGKALLGRSTVQYAWTVTAAIVRPTSMTY